MRQATNEQATKNKVRDYLKGYRQKARVAGLTLTNEPVATAGFAGITAATGLQVALNQITQTALRLPAESYQVLFYSYFTKDKLTDDEIADKLLLANDRAVRYRRGIALLEFAEAYQGSTLYWGS